MLGALRLTEETRRVVERYDAALQQVAQLSSENRSLKENLRRNEVKVMRLIKHYQEEIDEQTNAITQLKNERRAQEIHEMNQRQKRFSDKSTYIGDGDFKSREAELESIIYMLEDEIQSLKDHQHTQQEDFNRRWLHNQAMAKTTFNDNMDVLKNMATDAVSAEVADALSELLRDNERLSNEFREVLDKMERLQMSREGLSKELMRTRRELEFMAYREKLMAKKLQDAQMKSDEVDSPQSQDEDTAVTTSDGLEEYFKESLRLCNSKV